MNSSTEIRSGAEVGFAGLAVKAAVLHTITYFICGALAAHFLHYAEAMAKPDSGMRPMTSLLVVAGPLFQPIRGLIFASVFYSVRTCLFGRSWGWLAMAWMLVALGILSTFGPAAGSVEGLIYTPTPVLLQLRGWIEVVPQAISLAILLWYWVRHAEKRWLNWLFGASFLIVIALDTMGVVMQPR
jgi:hypothetical protein